MLRSAGYRLNKTVIVGGSVQITVIKKVLEKNFKYITCILKFYLRKFVFCCSNLQAMLVIPVQIYHRCEPRLLMIGMRDSYYAIDPTLHNRKFKPRSVSSSESFRHAYTACTYDILNKILYRSNSATTQSQSVLVKLRVCEQYSTVAHPP